MENSSQDKATTDVSSNDTKPKPKSKKKPKKLNRLPGILLYVYM